MPFADARRPAIGVSLLKAALLQRGRSARIRYFSLDVAQDLGGDVYKQMASELPSETLPGEWIFARAAFPDHDFPPADEYLAGVLRPVRGGPEVEAAAVSLRDRADRFVDRWLREVVAIGPRVVGFTCTFQQTVPSLALARRLKELPDPPTIVFGGASCEGEMGLELLRSFPWIDAVCTQEGDHAFPDALPRLLDGEDHAGHPGPGLARETSGSTPPPRSSTSTSSPCPTTATTSTTSIGPISHESRSSCRWRRLGGAGGAPSTTARSAVSTGVPCRSGASRPTAPIESSPSSWPGTASIRWGWWTTSSTTPISGRCCHGSGTRDRKSVSPGRSRPISGTTSCSPFGTPAWTPSSPASRA